MRHANATEAWASAFAAAIRLDMVTGDVDMVDLLEWARELQMQHSSRPAAAVAREVWQVMGNPQALPH